MIHDHGLPNQVQAHPDHLPVQLHHSYNFVFFSSSKRKCTPVNAPERALLIPLLLAATSMSAGITHIVGIDERNRDHFANSTATFSKMRVTIHTTGAWPNSPYSDNHVTIFLILNEVKAVHLNMRTDANDRRGQLIWKEVDFRHSHSEIKFFDYDLGSPVQVKTLYGAIRYDWHFHQYLFSAGGSGCHFWKYSHARRFEVCRRLLTC